MRHFLLALFAVFMTVALTLPDAEAKRFGGTRNSGMQRDSGSYMKRDAAPQSPAQQPGAAPQTPQKRSWLGPVAGLAAGLGLAALASHFGFGEGMANILLIALLVMGAFLLFNWFARRALPPPQSMRYAGPAPDPQPMRFDAPQAMGGTTAAPAAGFPPGFDAEAFTRQAKVNFLRLQAANDAGNLDDIREFTSPEMYAEIKLDIDERKGATQKTEVTLLNAEVLDASEDGKRQIVSVRFHGLIKEDAETPAPFDETWHLTRPADGKGGWVVAGIQQNA